MKSRVAILSVLLLAGTLPPVIAAQAPAPLAKEQASLPRGAADYWKAMDLMQNGSSANLKSIRRLLQDSAELDFAPARLQLGLALQNGSLGFSKNPKKAFQQFLKGAGQGDGFCLVCLGQLYLEGNGCKKDLAKAREQFLAAVSDKASFARPLPPANFQAGPGRLPTNSSLASAVPSADPADQMKGLAYTALGDISASEGKLPLAQDYYLKGAALATASNFSAVVKVAVNYALGSGCVRDQERAELFFEQARRMGRRMGAAYAHSLVEQKLLDDFVQGELEDELKTRSDQELLRLYAYIGDTLGNPKGAGYDPQAAARWYRRGFEDGDPWAGVHLAFLHLGGSLGPADEKAAFGILEKLVGGDPLNIVAANLAICLERGIGTEPDHRRAAELFRKYQDQEYLCHLGAAGRCPERPVEYAAALELHRKAAEAGSDSQAQFLWGQRFEMGWGVEKNYAEALKWYQLAAKARNPSALCALGLAYEFHPDDLKVKDRRKAAELAVSHYRAAADAGNPYGMQNLASCYKNGYGVGEDLEQAEAWYIRCLELRPDHGTAHNNYATLLRKQFDEAKAKDRAIEAAALRERFLMHFQKGADLGNSYAERNLAYCYLEGLLPDPDHRLAYRYFDSAANHGDIIAHRELGGMLQKGIGVPVTYQEAAYHYRIAALAGDAPALERLCILYLEGKGVSQDSQRASQWLTRLAETTKQVPPLISLGNLMLRNGDFEEARKVLEDVCKGDDSLWGRVARYRLSGIYEQGLGVKADPKRARRMREEAFDGMDAAKLYEVATSRQRFHLLPGSFDLLEMSMAMGFKPARSTLAWSLITGDLTVQDGERGWSMLQGLVKEGDLEALTWTAYGTLQEVEGAPGLQEAIDCASKASQRGDKRAAQILAALQRRASS